MAINRTLFLALMLAALCSDVRAEMELGNVLESAAKLEDWLISTRRELHMYPELMFQASTHSHVVKDSN